MHSDIVAPCTNDDPPSAGWLLVEFGVSCWSLCAHLRHRNMRKGSRGSRQPQPRSTQKPSSLRRRLLRFFASSFAYATLPVICALWPPSLLRIHGIPTHPRHISQTTTTTPTTTTTTPSPNCLVARCVVTATQTAKARTRLWSAFASKTFPRHANIMLGSTCTNICISHFSRKHTETHTHLFQHRQHRHTLWGPGFQANAFVCVCTFRIA